MILISTQRALVPLSTFIKPAAFNAIYLLQYINLCYYRACKVESDRNATSWKSIETVRLLFYISMRTRGDCEWPCFDQLNAHILGRLLLCWRSKMCTCSWSKYGRIQSTLVGEVKQPNPQVIWIQLPIISFFMYGI